ncbi:MAG: AAA family ATPase [Elusimicrobiota bacterium]
MYLKKLKVFGFKSFADEMVLDFSQGITAIVGPNGCGKSNILDAFNWVLGEQSATRLRGNMMQDMIFHGSRTRKPLGVASVELCFDNSKDLLAIDYSEVTVTRKLYRSGESEYYINKNPCRLKDIRELFCDTGIGTRAYSVMEQDNIKYILESSPVERRGIIEEAAGIRKYKEKKVEAERRLERIRRDLNEVKNIMGEVQKNIRRLKLQKRRAQMYQEYRKQLGYLEISKLCQDYISISEQLGGKLKETGGLQVKVTILSAEKDKIDSRVLKLENEKAEMDEKLLTDNRSVYQMESKIEIIRQRIDNYDDSQKMLEEEIKRHENNCEYNKTRIQELSSELTRLDEKKQESREIESKYKKVEQEYNSLKTQQGKLLEEIAGLSDANEVLEEELLKMRHLELELKTREEVSEKRVDELTSRKKELEKSAGSLKKEMEEKTDLLKDIEKELDRFTGQIDKLHEEKDSVNEKIQKAETEREELLTKYHSIKSQYDSGKKYLPQLISIERLAHQKLKGIYGSISVLLEKDLNEDEMKKFNKILGEKISWIVADTKQDAVNAIKFLKKEALPPLTFVLKDVIPEIKSTFNMPGNIKGYLKSIINFFMSNLKMDGEFVWHGDCIISGGGEMPLRVLKILGLESEIEEIEDLLKKCELSGNSLKGGKDKIQDSLREAIENRNNLQYEVSTLKQQVGELIGSYDYTSNELRMTEDKLKNITSKEKLEKELQEISGRIVSEKQKYETKKQLLKDKKAEQTGLTEKTAMIEARKSTIYELISREKENYENISRQREQLAQDLERTEKIIADLEYKKGFQAEQNEKDLDEIKEFEQQKKTQMSTVGELEDKRGYLVRELKELKISQKEHEVRLEKIKDNVGEQRQTEERLKERVENIKIRLEEDMDTKIDKALEDYSKDPVNDEDIASLKEKLAKIGEVNLEAPREYEKEFQRFEFIKKHVDDLEEADADIRSIIRKINRQTKDKFQDTFNAINENFKNIFKKLFEGGNAHLRLIEPDNILESGIEIEAQPEGKNVSSIIQFSGGESALCAIALMFAIYEVKPTPFCILDEVDSPLDDSNLHRFLRMLKSYIDNTQFIIVTHNKNTMEMSDTFYGITMEEFGVSKTISVKIKDTKAVTA